MDPRRRSLGLSFDCARVAAVVTMLGVLGMVAIPSACGGERAVRQGRSGEPSSGRAPLQFHSELIRIDTRGDSIEVDGLYRFLCLGKGRPAMTLLFPYPEDSLLGGARTEFLEEILSGGGSRALRFEELSSGRGALWFLDVPAKDTVVVRTVYRQRLLGCSARYIVTTTGFWQRPLAHARFEVVLPRGIEPPSFNYPFEVDPQLDAQTWVFETTEFSPEEDIEIRWDCP